MRLIVDVARAEPLAGSVRTTDGAERDFTTWLGLLAVLRDAVGDELPQEAMRDQEERP